jgi:membrane protein implicated in regulation of membrane protease activity
MESLISILITIGGIFLAVWFVVEMFCSVSDVECTMGLVFFVFFAIIALFSIIMWLLTRKWNREDEEWRKKYYNKKK